MLPVIALAVVAVPLLVLAFRAVRRSRTAAEHPPAETAEARRRTEQEFEQSEQLQAEWRAEEREHPRDTIL